MRALRGLRLHTRAKRQRQKARSEMSVANEAAGAAKSAAVAPRVRVLRSDCFFPGQKTWPARVRLGVPCRVWRPGGRCAQLLTKFDPGL